jgi:hypothetical protein
MFKRASFEPQDVCRPDVSKSLERTLELLHPTHNDPRESNRAGRRKSSTATCFLDNHRRASRRLQAVAAIAYPARNHPEGFCARKGKTKVNSHWSEPCKVPEALAGLVSSIRGTRPARMRVAGVAIPMA